MGYYKLLFKSSKYKYLSSDGGYKITSLYPSI